MKNNIKVNQLKVGATLSYISMGVGYVVSIIYTPIMLRLLGQSEYGLYNLVASVVAYLGVLNFGFGSAYIRYYARYKVKNEKKNIAKLNGMFLMIYTGIGLIAALAGTLLAINSENILGTKLTVGELSKAKILITILVINLAISFPNMVFASYITANEKFIFQKIIQVIKTVVNPFVVLPILLLGYGSVGMVIVTTILNVLIEICNVVFCIKKLDMKFSFKEFDFGLMKKMTVFSSFIFMNLIIDQINWNVDKFILGRYHGTITVAVYGLAAQLNTYYVSLSTVIPSVFVPRIHRIVAEKNGEKKLTELFTKIGRIQFIILALISSGLVMFGKPFINLWAGNNYNSSYFIMLLLVLPVTIPLVQNIGIEIQRAMNMHQFRSWVYLFIALANVLITIPLAKVMGGVGAALGTAIALIIGNVFIMNWYYKAKIGLDMKIFWKQIFSFTPSLILPLSFGILVNKVVDLYSIKYFISCGILYIVIYSISMWFIGMNNYEKDLVRKPLSRIWEKFQR